MIHIKQNKTIILIFFIILGIPSLWVNAWAFQIAWELLASPFGWVLPFTLNQLVVIFFLKRFILKGRHKSTENERGSYEDIVSPLLSAYLIPVFFIFLAWIISLIIH